MSLNWREIEQILTELDLENSHIQQVLQPDFKTLILELYSPRGRSSLLVSLEQGATRIHETSRRFRKSKTPQRFETLLRARIRGSRITAVEHVRKERILRIDVERSDEEQRLWIRLWGGSANILLTDRTNTIIDAFFRRPKRAEVSGALFDVGKELSKGKHSEAPEQAAPPPDSGEEIAFPVRDWSSFDTLNEAIDWEYGEARRTRELEKLRERAKQVLEGAAVRSEARIGGLERQLESTVRADSDRKCGDLILANIHSLPPHSEKLIADDWDSPGVTIEVALNPALSPQQNAERYYERARKRERERQHIADQLEVARAQAAGIAAEREDLKNIAEEERLERILSHYGKGRGTGRSESGGGGGSRGGDGGSRGGGGGSRGGGKQTGKSKGPAPGITLERGGFTIFVGRNARENDELLRRHVRGNDLWIHTRDYAGGYVFIRARAGKSIPLEIMLDAAQLAIRFSKAPDDSSAVDLYYTPVKNLRRAKDGPKGLVLPTAEKNLSVTPDSERLRTVLENR